MSWEEITQNLDFRDDIYFARDNPVISYPREANDAYFSIEDRSFWFAHRAQCITEAAKNFPPSGEIYDIGGGNGHVARALEGQGFKTVLVEPGIQGVLNARQRGLKRLICSTFESAGFPQNSLPAVGLFDVLEHIRQDGTFLTALHKGLTAGGLIYLTVPAYGILWSQEDDYAGHFRRYTLGSLHTVARESGFKTLYATCIFSFLPAAIFLLRSLSYRFNLNAKTDPNKLSGEHTLPNNLAGNSCRRILEWEVKSIRNRQKIIAGASVLAVLKAS